MPKAKSVRSAILERFIIRERFIAGFSVWQSGIFQNMSQIDMGLMLAPAFGRQLTDIFVIKPQWIPSWYEDIFYKMLDKASDQLEREKAIHMAKRRGETVVAPGTLTSSTEDLLKKMDSIGEKD